MNFRIPRAVGADPPACRTGRCVCPSPKRIATIRSQLGFTLLELMIALSIMAIMLTILYKTFAATIDLTDRVERETDIYRMGQLSLSIMSEELRSTYWEKDHPHAEFIGTSDSLGFTALSRHRYGEEIQGPQLAALNYYLELIPTDPSDKPNVVFVHEEETNLLSLSSKSLQRTELAERVHGLAFRYLGKDDWEEEWDTYDSKKLPRAVEIHLILLDESDKPYDFFTRVDIPISSIGSS